MSSNRDLSLFNKALLDLYAPGLDLENYPERGFKFLSSQTSSDLTVYGVRDTNSNNANIILHLDRAVPGMEQAVVPFGLMAPKYPWFCVHPETNRGKPHYRSDYYSDRQYKSLDIHSEVFCRWGHLNFMSMCVRATPEKVFFFGTSRTRGDYSHRERSVILMAQAHLVRARSLAVRLSASKPWSVSPEKFCRHGFTPRECEVLYWLTEGKSNIEIATILNIGLPTVKGYLTSIFNKTGTGNRLAATLHAVELVKSGGDFEVAWKKDALLIAAPLGPYPTKVG